MNRPRPRPPASWCGPVVAGRPAGRHVGLADPGEDRRGEAPPVVGDGDRDLAVVPGGADLDPALGEVDGVLDEVGERLDDRRVAAADRLGAIGPAAARWRSRCRRRGRARPPPRRGG